MRILFLLTILGIFMNAVHAETDKAGAGAAEKAGASGAALVEKIRADKTLNFHLMHPGPTARPGDPNPAFFSGGLYHLHYIYNNEKEFCFAHVTSPDMLHWTWHKTVFKRSFTGHGMFSGTGFLTKDGKPAMIYHGEGSGRNQIAIAKDDSLEDWEKPYPIIPEAEAGRDMSIMDQWDPDCFQVDGTYYAIFGGNPGRHKPATLIKSADLKKWSFLGPFLKQDMPDVKKDEDISCPNFFKIGNKWMLLCISHNWGCRYYLGEFKDEQFVPDFHARMNWRAHRFFAPESVLTPDGRRVMWAWVLPDQEPFRSAGLQSLPREISLPADGVLRIKPLRELETLRTGEKRKENVELKAEPLKLDDLPGEAVEIRAKISLKGDSVAFRLFGDEPNKGMTVLVDTKNKTLQVGETKAPLDIPANADGTRDMELRIFIDRYMVEVFANDRQAVLESYLDFKNQSSLSVTGAGTIQELQVWKIKPTNAGFLEAQKSGSWK